MPVVHIDTSRTRQNSRSTGETGLSDMVDSLDSLTVLLAADEDFLQTAAVSLRDEWDDVTVLSSTSPENTFARLRDHEVDCVVSDTTLAPDVEGFASRVQSEHPKLPLILRLTGGSEASVPEVVRSPHVDILWAREDGKSLDELATRIAVTVATAHSDENGESVGQPDENGASMGRSAEQIDRIEGLHELAAKIATCHTEEAVYERTVAAAERILDFDLCCALVYEDGLLRPKALSSDAPPDGARAMRPDQGQAGAVFQTGESQITSDSHRDDTAEPAKECYRSGLTVPLSDVGVFQAVSTRPGTFTERDLELTELLVSHTQTALDRIRFERQLQNERDRFQALIGASSDIVTVLEPDGTVQYQSPSIEHTLGYLPEEMAGDRVFEYIHPDDREGVFERFTEVLHSPGRELSVEFRFRHSDGNWRVLESLGRNHLDDPAVEGIVVNSRDVTERKERLQILETLPTVASELGDAETMEGVADVTVVTAQDVLDLPITGVWLYDADENALQPVAYTSESEALFDDHPTFTPDGESLSWRTFETGEFCTYEDVNQESAVHNPQTPVKSEMILPLGQYGVVNVGSTERESFSDVDVYFARILAAMAAFALGRFDQEGKLRQQQEKLRRQNERLDEFASVVSHDLRNPLNVASLRLGLAREQHDSDDLAAVADALDRMTDIIEDVLTLAREGETIGETEPVDLDRVAMTAWRGVETDTADVTVSTEVSISADEGRLRRLFENLIHNAMKHGEASHIRVGPLWTDGEFVGFYVADDGSGVPAVDHENVFEVGFTTATTGTGFGLAIVDRIADAHGWTVSVADSSMGGARFEVRDVELA